MNYLTLLLAISYTSVQPTTFYTNYYTPENTDHAIIYSGNVFGDFDPVTLHLSVAGDIDPVFADDKAAQEFNQQLSFAADQTYYEISDETDQPFLNLDVGTALHNPTINLIRTSFAPDLSWITLICCVDQLYNGSVLELGASIYLQQVQSAAETFNAETPEPSVLLLLGLALAAYLFFYKVGIRLSTVDNTKI